MPYKTIIAILVIVLLVVLEAARLPFLLWIIETMAGWARALPAPTENFANLVGDLTWPLAALLIFWWLREPIAQAASILAERFKHDDVEIAGWLKITAADLTTLDREAVIEQLKGTGAATDAEITESLLEYAGSSDFHASKLLKWIEGKFGTDLDPEDFINEVQFEESRKNAYIELVTEGKNHD